MSEQMKVAGIAVVIDNMTPEGAASLSYPPKVEAWRRPGGESLDVTVGAYGTNLLFRCRWAPDIGFLRVTPS